MQECGEGIMSVDLYPVPGNHNSGSHPKFYRPPGATERSNVDKVEATEPLLSWKVSDYRILL